MFSSLHDIKEDLQLLAICCCMNWCFEQYMCNLNKTSKQAIFMQNKLLVGLLTKNEFSGSEFWFWRSCNAWIIGSCICIVVTEALFRAFCYWTCPPRRRVEQLKNSCTFFKYLGLKRCRDARPSGDPSQMPQWNEMQMLGIDTCLRSSQAMRHCTEHSTIMFRFVFGCSDSMQ
jgi:hypothetical protein